MKERIEITVKVNGEVVPLSSLSDEAISNIKQQERQQLEKNVPVFSKLSNRLVVKLTPTVIKTMRELIRQLDSENYYPEKGSYMSFEPNGLVGTYYLGKTQADVLSSYSGGYLEAIFPGK